MLMISLVEAKNRKKSRSVELDRGEVTRLSCIVGNLGARFCQRRRMCGIKETPVLLLILILFLFSIVSLRTAC